MDLLINNINFSNIRFGRQKNVNTNSSPGNKVLQSTSILPCHAVYSDLSIYKAKSEFAAENFMLPAGTKPDKYQLSAARSLQKGNNTVVTAPTGTGKTAIAHFVIKKNFNEGKKTFYTTPLKALSNQKYLDLKKLFGEENVGILTGDRKENAKAPIVVMTTEIYRNMVASQYFKSKNNSTNNLKTVIFDEFHYMGDADRGNTWEESIMFTPADTQILALSATVGNNTQIADWINAIKNKPVDLIDVPTKNRHVPLKFIMYNPNERETSSTARKSINLGAIIKRFYSGSDKKKDKEVLNILAQKMGYPKSQRGRSQVINAFQDKFKNNIVPIKDILKFLQENYGIKPIQAHYLILKLTDKKDTYFLNKTEHLKVNQTSSPRNPKNIINLISNLKTENKLPAITFVFNKKYSEELLNAAASVGRDLNSNKEKEEIINCINQYKENYDFYSTNFNLQALLKGYAIHSAAILPLQKQLVEELFNKKLIKVVFATETLAAGINMPARSVIMTDCQKPGGKSVNQSTSGDFLRPLSANEFHQMCGRAGRRGIDKIGYVILLNDSPEKQEGFENLITAEPDAVSSSLKIDASNVTGLFENLTNPKDMERLLGISFSIFNTPTNEKSFKLKNLMTIFHSYVLLLQKYGFLKKVPNGFSTTEQGELISCLKGKPQIPIVKAILDKRFANVPTQDFAAIISAIAANQSNETELLPIGQNSVLQIEKRLSDINSAIDCTLFEDFDFYPNTLSSKNTNDEIIMAIEGKYGEILKKDADKISEQCKYLQKLIYCEEKNLKKNLMDESSDFDKIFKLKNQVQQLKDEQTVLNRITYIKDLLDERLGLSLQALSAGEFSKNDVYNTLVRDFEDYNSNISDLSTDMDEITLNKTAFILVGKWAELNSSSADYKSNWKSICTMLKENGAIKYEGDLFNAISQTIDFTHQIETLLLKALKNKNLKNNDKEYYESLLLKCNDVVSLLKKPPLYNVEKA